MTFKNAKKNMIRGISTGVITMMGNLARYHLFRQKRLSPVYVVWHPTLRCNLSCAFCDDGKGRKYPDVIQPELNTHDALKLLELLRAASRAIYFTGGEPFVRKDFPELLKYSHELGFQPIFVNTNLTQRGPLEAAVHNIDVLVASLGSTDCAGYDRVIRGSRGQTARILENLAYFVRQQGRGGPLVIVNCVVSANRIHDAWSVYELCKQLGAWFSPVPEIKGCYMDPLLSADAGYRQTVAKWLAEKKEGAGIYGSLRGLEILLNERPFRCYPQLAPQIYPNGDLFYPCKPLGKTTYNVLALSSFKRALEKSLNEFSAMPDCDNRCHLACYVSNNQWMEHPLEMVRENLHMIGRVGTKKN